MLGTVLAISLILAGTPAKPPSPTDEAPPTRDEYLTLADPCTWIGVRGWATTAQVPWTGLCGAPVLRAPVVFTGHNFALLPTSSPKELEALRTERLRAARQPGAPELIAVAALAQGAADTALVFAALAAKLKPESAEAANLLATALVADGNTVEARKALLYAHSLAPKNVVVLSNLGHLMRDEPASARHWFEAALELEPDHPAAVVGIRALSPDRVSLDSLERANKRLRHSATNKALREAGVPPSRVPAEIRVAWTDAPWGSPDAFLAARSARWVRGEALVGQYSRRVHAELKPFGVKPAEPKVTIPMMEDVTDSTFLEAEHIKALQKLQAEWSGVESALAAEAAVKRGQLRGSDAPSGEDRLGGVCERSLEVDREYLEGVAAQIPVFRRRHRELSERALALLLAGPASTYSSLLSEGILLRSETFDLQMELKVGERLSQDLERRSRRLMRHPSLERCQRRSEPAVEVTPSPVSPASLPSVTVVRPGQAAPTVAFTVVLGPVEWRVSAEGVDIKLPPGLLLGRKGRPAALDIVVRHKDAAVSLAGEPRGIVGVQATGTFPTLPSASEVEWQVEMLHAD